MFTSRIIKYIIIRQQIMKEEAIKETNLNLINQAKIVSQTIVVSLTYGLILQIKPWFITQRMALKMEFVFPDKMNVSEGKLLAFYYYDF